MQFEERGSRAGTHQSARMNIALRDDAVKRRLERQILREVFDRLDLRLRGLDRILVRTYERLRRLGGLLRDDDVVFGHNARSGGGGLQALVGTLRGRQFRSCLSTLDPE